MRTVTLMALAIAWFAFAGAGVANTQSASSAPPLATQTSSGGGVTVKVTPKSLAPEGATWQFEVVLDTHSGALGQDMAKSAVLVDAQGREHAATAWTGDPPGGHHRKGVLTFKPLAAGTDEITLQIRDVGVPQRSFRWSLKTGAR